MWRFIERARGARPLFDDVIHVRPWTEEQIAALLKQRSRLADIDPRFDALMGELPPNADEEDHQQALKNTEANYHRLLWDYSGGNPAVALQFWRKSLLIGPEGDYHVELFSAPDTTDLERLPDLPVFVLRAILQLDYASVANIVQSTLLPPLVVHDAIRYAIFRGYVIEARGRYRVHWTWYRAITRFLERRHLLPAMTRS